MNHLYKIAINQNCGTNLLKRILEIHKKNKLQCLNILKTNPRFYYNTIIKLLFNKQFLIILIIRTIRNYFMLYIIFLICRMILL